METRTFHLADLLPDALRELVDLHSVGTPVQRAADRPPVQPAAQRAGAGDQEAAQAAISA